MYLLPLHTVITDSDWCMVVRIVLDWQSPRNYLFHSGQAPNAQGVGSQDQWYCPPGTIPCILSSVLMVWRHTPISLVSDCSTCWTCLVSFRMSSYTWTPLPYYSSQLPIQTYRPLLTNKSSFQFCLNVKWTLQEEALWGPYLAFTTNGLNVNDLYWHLPIW